MKIKLETVKREICGETYLVPIGEAAHNYSGLFVLTDVAAFIWDVLPEADNEAAIVDAVLAEYEVDRATAEADVREFLAKLTQFGII